MSTRTRTRSNPKKDTTPRTISGSKVEDLKSKPDHFLECRENGHAWKRIGYYRWNDLGNSAICRRNECMRCGTSRDTFYHADGRRFGSPIMDYPEGYLVHGEGTCARKDAVVESIRRSKVYARVENIPAVTPPLKLVKIV